MASGKTENYGLNQWEATDKVERLDFNADNTKIDAALHDMEQARAAAMETLRAERLWVKVGECTLDSAATSITYTVPNAEQYQSLLVYYYMQNGHHQIFLSVNDTSSDNRIELYSIGSDNTANRSVGQVHIVPFSNRGGLLESSSAIWYNSDYTRSNHNITNFTDALSGSVNITVFHSYSRTFAAGSQIVVYGLKK